MGADGDLTAETLAVITKNASIVARRYCAKVWWASKRDLVSAAVVEQIEALRRKGYDPTVGPPEGAYLFSIAVYAARRELIKQSAPVTHQHRLERLIGLHRAPLFTEQEDGEVVENRELPADSTPSPEAATEQLHRAVAVRARVLSLVGARCASFVLGMSGEWTAQEIAESNGATVQEVTAQYASITASLWHDEELRALWRESS